jgi:uncharacterized membrane protein
MSSLALALKLTRRRRPPPERLIFYVLWCGFCLYVLFHAVYELLLGDVFALAVLVAFVPLFLFWRLMARMTHWTWEEDDRPVRPVHPLEWSGLLLNVAVQALILVATGWSA